jgi:hypothetical protein
MSPAKTVAVGAPTKPGDGHARPRRRSRSRVRRSPVGQADRRHSRQGRGAPGAPVTPPATHAAVTPAESGPGQRARRLEHAGGIQRGEDGVASRRASPISTTRSVGGSVPVAPDRRVLVGSRRGCEPGHRWREGGRHRLG